MKLSLKAQGTKEHAGKQEVIETSPNTFMDLCVARLNLLFQLSAASD